MVPSSRKNRPTLISNFDDVMMLVIALPNPIFEAITGNAKTAITMLRNRFATDPKNKLSNRGCSSTKSQGYIPLSIREIGCCGAYCKTCLKWQKDKYPNEKHCLGCKLGYNAGARDASKARCKMKVCCFVEKKIETCADCQNYPCETLKTFWGKNGYKYSQYKKQLEFIRKNGYKKYLKCAETWKRAHGKLLN